LAANFKAERASTVMPVRSAMSFIVSPYSAQPWTANVKGAVTAAPRPIIHLPIVFMAVPKSRSRCCAAERPLSIAEFFT
jgi:hypothetical protein